MHHTSIGRLAATLAAALLLGASSAQGVPAWSETGTVHLDLAGEPRTFHTYATVVSDDVPDGVRNELAREILADLAGTTQHSAVWQVPKPMMMGDIVIRASTVMFVSVTTRPTGDASIVSDQVMLDFGLDLAKLELHEGSDVSIRYFLDGYSSSDYYALTEGGIEIASVERVDDHTLRIRGTFSGMLSFQTDWRGVAHNPDDILSVSASFDFLEVVGTDVLAEVLQAE
jgi:hypothetical protein